MTNKASKSTLQEDKLLQKSLVTCGEKTQAITLGIMYHSGEGDKVRYVVCWYGNTAADDTTESFEHIADHLSFAIGAEWRIIALSDIDVDEHTRTGKERL